MMRHLLSLLVAVFLVFLTYACASTEVVQIGMSQEEVVELLGEPDRKAVLVGKMLRDIDKIPTEDSAAVRLVYVYEKSGLQVWFQDGKVTGSTQYGVSVK